MVRKAQEQTFT